MSTAPDPRRCPLCGQPNDCAMQRQRDTGEPQPPCWCTTVRFERVVLERIPTEARRLACVCRACATAATPAPPSA
ncbi:cysteine-rich CWC family protein [Variovorax terrae]|uniref:Cysteine-rich CWC family protein n=1 Tax=Variovorax terrae TaxID=2923278 RepID=A0A9X1VYY0_9BURK|nr:cysteine-rich CWC family protein [Variovorax terrae]MCJ0766017.1 cysteine-rich CWC family protein [Variovorax terrae]